MNLPYAADLCCAFVQGSSANGYDVNIQGYFCQNLTTLVANGGDISGMGFTATAYCAGAKEAF